MIGLPMKFKEASEPTDIIWENRVYTKTDYWIRSFFAFSIIGVLLLGSFAFIYKVARTSADIAIEFPKVDCAAIEQTYGT